jgi:hypothetical protein
MSLKIQRVWRGHKVSFFICFVIRSCIYILFDFILYFYLFGWSVWSMDFVIPLIVIISSTHYRHHQARMRCKILLLKTYLSKINYERTLHKKQSIIIQKNWRCFYIYKYYKTKKSIKTVVVIQNFWRTILAVRSKNLRKIEKNANSILKLYLFYYVYRRRRFIRRDPAR